MAETKNRPNDVVKIKKGNRTGSVARSSFESVWKHKGWEEAKEDDNTSAGGADAQAVKEAQEEQERAAKEAAKSSSNKS